MASGNRFWGKPGEESSESSSASESSDSDTPVAAVAQASKPARARWADDSSSDDEVDQKRVVRKAADKRYEAMLDIIKLMKNHVKIEDYATITSDLADVVAAYEKVKKLPDFSGTPPNQLVVALARLEEFVEAKHTEFQEKKGGNRQASTA